MTHLTFVIHLGGGDWLTRLMFLFKIKFYTVVIGYFFVNLLDVRAKDLVPIPKKPETTTEGRPAKKVPNWY